MRPFCCSLYLVLIVLSSWRCCMCGMSNEVPQLFDWDQTRNQPGDRWARAELTHAVVEFVAPTEYMVRPPQPAVYIFLIDVSHSAIQSGTPPIFERLSMAYIKQAWSPLQPEQFSRTWIDCPMRISAPKSQLSPTIHLSTSSRWR